MKSKTKIEKQLIRKNNPNLVEIIIKAKKNIAWLKVADILSRPRRKKIALNLDKINQLSKDGDIIIVPGKVLSRGNINKKIKIVALNFSGAAKEKLLKSKIQTSTILDEIKKNQEAKGVKILTK